MKTLCAEHPWIESAERVHLNESLVGDVTNHESDFVHVCGNSNRVLGIAVYCSDDITHRVGADAIDALGKLATDDVSYVVFVARGASSLCQLTQEVVRKSVIV